MPGKKVRSESVAVAAGGPDLATIEVHKTLYPADVLFGTAFTFLDRCYVHLDVADKERVRVTIRRKKGVEHLTAADLAGEFANEMVNQAVRLRLAKQTESVRTSIVKRAIEQSLPVVRAPVSSEPPPAPDLPPEVAKILAEEDDNLDFLDDPLGIAVPWEEKYGKKEGGSPGPSDETPSNQKP